MNTDNALKKIIILGSTGSVGSNTLNVIERNSLFDVLAITGNNNYRLLAKQALKFNPKYVIIGNKIHYKKLKYLLEKTSIIVESGYDSILSIAKMKSDITVCAISGNEGISSTFSCIGNTGILALANKESIVCGGQILFNLAKKHNTKIIPVDSEHSAIFNILEKFDKKDIENIIITASGGPFLNYSKKDMENITPSEALKHPTWTMGKKITIDSASMMNKGLEIIEACYLFDLKHQDIDVIIHPQSIVHSMVNLKDGSTIAQLGDPDMRLPISSAIFWPNYMPNAIKTINFSEIKNLSFSSPDLKRFPSLSLARYVIDVGCGAPIVYSKANEIAVNAFLLKKIKFLDIFKVVEMSLNDYELTSNKIVTLDNIFETVALSEKYALKCIDKIIGRVM
ncbi:MAG: 1-deoxy-D-xylulose-5-phosphate reductoisomerase [Alphaproteobacteria bacterium]|jgi:1-deoxy-D-xylulose-5-phosphate reductoisomerase